MIKLPRTAAGLVAALTLALPASAMAHPKLLSATPSSVAIGKPTQRVVLVFSERLTPRLSGATLTLVGTGGTEAKIAARPAEIGEDGKTLIVVPTNKLRAGSYRVDWHVVGADTHRITGKHTFRFN